MKMSLTTTTLIGLAMAVAVTLGAAQSPPITDSSEELLGELPEDQRTNQVTMAVSALGHHVAWVGKQGAAPTVFVNGRPVSGPAVEDIEGLALSPLGDHVAWSGKQGKSWLAILDGQPVHRRCTNSSSARTGKTWRTE